MRSERPFCGIWFASFKFSLVHFQLEASSCLDREWKGSDWLWFVFDAKSNTWFRINSIGVHSLLEMIEFIFNSSDSSWIFLNGKWIRFSYWKISRITSCIQKKNKILSVHSVSDILFYSITFKPNWIESDESSKKQIFLIMFAGASMWSLSSQHGRIHFGKRIQFEEFTDHSSIGSADIWIVTVRSQSKESPTNGASNTQSSSAEAIHVSCWRRFPRVSRRCIFPFQFISRKQ